jgi:hypothetical protein
MSYRALTGALPWINQTVLSDALPLAGERLRRFEAE